jgi:hypothetical protein
MEEKDTALNSATFAFAGVQALGMALVEAVGLDQTNVIRSGVWEKLGTGQGQMVKQQLGLEGDVDLQTAYQVLEQVVNVIGVETEVIESSPNKITMKVSACPVFNAGAAIGMDPAGIEEGCQYGAMPFLTAIVKQLNPNMSVRLAKFRGTPDKCCFEEIVLEA